MRTITEQSIMRISYKIGQEIQDKGISDTISDIQLFFEPSEDQDDYTTMMANLVNRYAVFCVYYRRQN